MNISSQADQGKQLSTPSKTPDNRNTDYYEFWKMPVGGQSILRFLPDLDESNPRAFFRQQITHHFDKDGHTASYPCIRTWYTNANVECPLCKYFSRVNKDNNQGANWCGAEYISNILIISDGIAKGSGKLDNQVRLTKFRRVLYHVIRATFESGFFEEVPFDYESGTNFVIKKSITDDKINYSESGFEVTQSALDVKTIEMVTSNLIDLSTLIPPKPEIYDYHELVAELLKNACCQPSSR
jgi:hypothetical protein